MIWFSTSYAYILNQTNLGTPTHWPNTKANVDIYLNTENGRSYEAVKIQEIVSDSIGQWNGLSRVTIEQHLTSGKNQNGVNEIIFSADPTLGSAVMGVTNVDYRQSDGAILEADITINERLVSLDKSAVDYLGNVLTHELGHFLGLGHGQVNGSTMFYLNARGHYILADDDKAGVYGLYPTGNSSKGSIIGKIFGGKNLTSVFGAQVQAISVKNGKVAAASVSELDGKFKINGLPLDDQYLIYTQPLIQVGTPSSLPLSYSNARTDFCEASKNYRGSFFQSCGGNAEGFPQAIKLSSSTLDIGNITIRCGLDSPPEYVQKKGATGSDFDLNAYTNSGLGGSFVGFFSDREMQLIDSQDIHDTFHVDLSGVKDWSKYSSSPLYLEIKVLNQNFYSVYKANVFIKNAVSDFVTTSAYTVENDGWVSINTVAHSLIDINVAESSVNDFEIKIKPELRKSYSTFSGNPIEKKELFPSIDEFKDNLYFYLVIATVVKKNDDGITYSQVASKDDFLSDNSYCPDAINTYALTNYSAKGLTDDSNKNKVAACGTVEDENNAAGGGPGGFMIGLIFSLILSYAVSRYSKMA